MDLPHNSGLDILPLDRRFFLLRFMGAFAISIPGPFCEAGSRVILVMNLTSCFELLLRICLISECFLFGVGQSPVDILPPSPSPDKGECGVRKGDGVRFCGDKGILSGVNKTHFFMLVFSILIHLFTEGRMLCRALPTT